MGCRVAFFGLLPCLIVLAACEDATGVEIIVNVGDTQTKTVELFVGEDPCGDGCTDLWTTKNNFSFTTQQSFTHPRARPLRAEVKGGRALFLLLPEDGHESKHVQAVGAIGFDSDIDSGNFEQRNATGAFVIETPFDAKGPAQYEVTLVATDTRGTQNIAMERMLVDVWSQSEPLPNSPDGQPERCAAFGFDVPGQAKQFVIVPADDHDCDGLIAETKCYAQTPTDVPADAKSYCIDVNGGKCIFGQHGCDAGTGDVSTCTGVVFAESEVGVPCFPAKACDLSDDCVGFPDKCRGALLDRLPPADAYDSCTLNYGYGADGSDGGIGLCQNTQLSIPLTRISIPTGLRCQSALLAVPAAGPLSWSNRLKLVPSTDNDAEITVDFGQVDCKLTLTVAGKIDAQTANSPSTLHEVDVRVDLSNGYSLWFPVAIHYAPVSATYNMNCADAPSSACQPPMIDTSLQACMSAQSP